jgi:hypothetical protein
MNHIWIELTPPNELSNEAAEKQVELANNMLNRLKKPGATCGQFSFDADRRLYKYGTPMVVRMLPQHGHWLNLDYLGREVK